ESLAPVPHAPGSPVGSPSFTQIANTFRPYVRMSHPVPGNCSVGNPSSAWMHTHDSTGAFAASVFTSDTKVSKRSARSENGGLRNKLTGPGGGNQRSAHRYTSARSIWPC